MARLGSFAASVDLPDHLRPWQAAGLTALFLPEGLPQASPEPSGSTPQETTTAAKPLGTGSGVSALHSPTPPTPPLANAIPWPEPWKAIAARVRSKPQIIITYASLTADVTGKPDPARRKLFQSILGYMAWPQGTSLFWPCTDWDGSPDAAAVARNIFLNGALSFGVTFVACFGAEAAHIATALFPPGSGDPEVRVLTLPAPEDLLGLLPHELHRAVAVLKALPIE